MLSSRGTQGAASPKLFSRLHAQDQIRVIAAVAANRRCQQQDTTYKDQKTFIRLGCDSTDKSFLLLFFKKEVLAFLQCSISNRTGEEVFIGNTASIASDRTQQRHAWDRNFFLIILAAIWFCILAGFVPDVLSHLAGGHVAFAPIVHVHAVFYVGWLILLTIQMTLVRSRRIDIHRRLGLIALLMIPAMVLLGPWTGLVMGRREFGTPDGDPQLLGVIFLDALNFAVIASAGVLMRGNTVVHRRLMLLATVFISGAGFARWLGASISTLMGSGVVSYYVLSYSAVLVLSCLMALYDLRTRGRLHPVIAAAMVFGITNNWIACVLHESPVWKPIAAKLLGH